MTSKFRSTQRPATNAEYVISFERLLNLTRMPLNSFASFDLSE